VTTAVPALPVNPDI